MAHARPATDGPQIEILAESVEQWPIERLTPYVNNSRSHSDEQIAKLAEAIETYGWTVPALVDESGVLIAGHGRLLAAQKLGIDRVPVIVARGWSEDKRRAYTIADNRLGELSGWDADILAINKEMHLDGDYSIDLPSSTVDDMALMPEVKPDPVEPSRPKRAGAAMQADKSKMLRFGRREIVLSPDELAWMNKKMETHLEQYGMAMGFVEQTLKPLAAGESIGL
jgi:ParB-like nuclease domain